MNLPALVLAILIATAVGLLYHLLRGGSFSRLGLYTLSSTMGFALGHLVATWFQWSILRMGSINLVAALFGSALALIAIDVLNPPEGAGPDSADDDPLHFLE